MRLKYAQLPEDNGGGDFDLVVIDDDGKPSCVLHGAMNKVSAEGFWRCITTSSPKGNNCRAGCREA
jgi:hypothetical protein